MSKVIKGNLPVARGRVLVALQAREAALQGKLKAHKAALPKLRAEYAKQVAAVLQRAATAAAKGKLPKVAYDGDLEIPMGKARAPVENPWAGELRTLQHEIRLVGATTKQTISLDPQEYALLFPDAK